MGVNILLMFLQMIETPDDQSKFEKIYTMYLKKMQYVAESILCDPNEAENIVHDTFVAIIDNLEKIDEKDCHKTWNYIVTILKNKCFNYIKKSNKIIYYEDYNVYEDKTESSCEEEILKKELVVYLAELIQSMRYPYKEVLYLRYYNDMNLKEISELLQINYDNTRQIYTRAKKQLRAKLEGGGYRYDNRPDD